MNEYISDKVLDAMLSRSHEELALGWLRYEALRKLNPRQFETLHLRNIAGQHENFDEMVDALMLPNIRS